jgi:hypothetical protein
MIVLLISAVQNILPAQQPVNIAGLQRQKPGPKAQSPQTKKAKVRTIGKKADASPSSESDSGDDSDLEVQEPDEPSPIPPSRPSEAVAAAKYDALMAVWSPRNKPPHVDKVKNALVTFKDIVKAIRDAWKESAQAMKMAENKGENDAATKTKEDVILRRRVINAVVTTALEKGHPRIVEKYVHSHPRPLTILADRCYGHRSQKRIVSFSCVILLVVDSRHSFLIMAISKGSSTCVRGLSLAFCPWQRREMESSSGSGSRLWSQGGRHSQYQGYVEDPTDTFPLGLNIMANGLSDLLRLLATTCLHCLPCVC